MNFIPLFVYLFAFMPDVQVLRWMSPDSSKPTPFRTWVSANPQIQGWNVEQLKSCRHTFNDRVDILVQDSLASALADYLDTLYLDLEDEGYDVAAFAITGTSCESLRAFLQREYQDSALTAAILIGNLPVAWFQMIDDWNNNGRRDPDDGYEEFPCDLYFMDLDGVWQDTWVRYDTFDSLVPGMDSIYDTHSGNVAPEIGIARIYAATIGKQDSLIRLYLERCHRYRTGGLVVTERALVYIDDDWTPWAGQWSGYVGYLYPERMFIADSEQTRIRDYKPRIDTAAYQWIQLCAHSWPGGHAMKYNHGQNWDWFYAESIPRIDPEACFYNLFACSNARFIERGYCGGRYVFQSTSGLGAIGSTKTGSMLEFQDFYYPLSNNYSLAQAFSSWFVQRAQGGFTAQERSWFYGMCLIGDGLLKPRFSVPVAENYQNSNRFQQPISTIIRNSFYLSERSALLLDKTGRALARICKGENNLRFLPAGVYFLKMTDDRKPKTEVTPIVIIH
ncbi:MAG: C25 family cysteine peptidase [candidate division WOR-3 bacterium]